MSEAKYKRVLLKLSGEALAGENKTGVNAETIGKIAFLMDERSPISTSRFISMPTKRKNNAINASFTNARTDMGLPWCENKL